MRFLGIIPARYGSTRFPAKPLAMLGGKPIIQHVYERVVGVVDMLVVATDNEEIFDCVRGFGGDVVMTSEHHKTGTDRCREAMEACGEEFDCVINIQGDEPFVKAEQLELLKSCMRKSGVDIATLIKEFSIDVSDEELANVNVPKVVVGSDGRAMMFSRSVIPHLRGVERDWARHHVYYKHIGIYAYKREALLRIAEMEQTPLEKAESLEQLRWLENGLRIQTAVTNVETIGIDTPEDLERAKMMIGIVDKGTSNNSPNK